LALGLLQNSVAEVLEVDTTRHEVSVVAQLSFGECQNNILDLVEGLSF
jgi:hypothetical protein